MFTKEQGLHFKMYMQMMKAEIGLSNIQMHTQNTAGEQDLKIRRASILFRSSFKISLIFYFQPDMLQTNINVFNECL